MDKPKITIDGKEIEMQTPKARLWREIIKFDSERRDLPVDNFVDEHAAIIAKAFNISVDEVLDNLEVSEILPTYSQVLGTVLLLLTEHLPQAKKNTVEVAEVQS